MTAEQLATLVSTIDAGVAWLGGLICALIVASIWRH